MPFEKARPIYKLPLPCQISKAHIRQDFIVGDQKIFPWFTSVFQGVFRGMPAILKGGLIITHLKAIIMHEKFILIATMPRYEDVF